MAEKKKISIQESHIVHDELCGKMTEIISNLKEVLELKKVRYGKETDKENKLLLHVEIEKLQNEILSKQNFLNKFKERRATKKDIK